MRHAKSSWKNQNQSDHDRPLNDRGNRDAPDMAQRLLQHGGAPDIILCSTAQRTRETTAHLLNVFGEFAPQVHYDKALYLASPDTMLAALLLVPVEIRHIMLVAHNPGIEDLSALLSGSSYDTMPTAAIRQFTCSSLAHLQTLRSASHASGATPSEDEADIQLVYSDYPKNDVS